MDRTMNLTGTDSIEITPTTALRRHYLLMVRKLKKPVAHANTQNPLDNKNPNPTPPSADADADAAKVTPNASGFKHIPKIAGVGILILLAVISIGYIEKNQHERALQYVQMNRLKNIALALRTSADTQDATANSFRRAVLSVSKDLEMLIDPVSEKPFVIVGNFAPEDEPQKVMAYTPWVEGKGGACALGDGSVQRYTPAQFKAMLQTLPPAKSGGAENPQ